MIRKLISAIQDSDLYFRLFHVKQPRLKVIGSCQQTGNCCRNLIIVDRGRCIASLAQFKRYVRRYPIYKMFQPHERNYDDGYLRFTCSNLTKQNTCGIYERRPRMCRAYPNINVLRSNEGGLLPGCGYQIVLEKSFDEVLESEAQKKHRGKNSEEKK